MKYACEDGLRPSLDCMVSTPGVNMYGFGDHLSCKIIHVWTPGYSYISVWTLGISYITAMMPRYSNITVWMPSNSYITVMDGYARIHHSNIA